MLVALGLGNAGITSLAAQSRAALSAVDLNGALAIQGRGMPDDQIELIRLALQHNLEGLQRIRGFEFPDEVSLPVVFRPRRL